MARRAWWLPLLSLALILLAVLAWIPSALELRQPAEDQVWQAMGLEASCRPGAFQLGWIGDGVGSGGGTLFVGSQVASQLGWLACRMAAVTALNGLQSELLLGLILTFSLSALACRLAGFRASTSLLAAFLITTAPCAFSRLTHLSLVSLWAVIPGLLACRGLWRAMAAPQPVWMLPAAGALAALLCLPAQEYYVAFTLLLLGCSYGVLLLLAATRRLQLRSLGRLALRGMAYGGGFLVILLWLYSPKLQAVTGGSGPPTAWSTPRLPIEQFRYGLLPFTWVIPPLWVPALRQTLEEAGIATGRESFFASSGSFLIPIAWVMAFWTLASGRPPEASPAAPTPTSAASPPSTPSPPPAPLVRAALWPAAGLQRSDLRFYALLLLLTSVVGLLGMTMGGLGTLFAVLVSPVLRSLNRFTAFTYGASVLMVVAVLDRWLTSRPARRRSR
ncbi:MAG: hypothetical protein ACKOXO_09930 [Cyanobium sp.]